MNKPMFSTQLFKLLNEVGNELPTDDINNITEFIENNEWGLAYEVLCLQLYEYNLPIHKDFYKKISNLGKSIGIESSIWLPLHELIIEKTNSNHNNQQ